MTPVSDRLVRIECMIHLVLAAYNAGRPVDSLHWAEEAIALGAAQFAVPARPSRSFGPYGRRCCKDLLHAAHLLCPIARFVEWLPTLL